MHQDLQVIVDQPSTGHFYWTIVHLGRPGETHSVIDYARGPLPTRNAATDAGMAALLGHTRVASPWQKAGPAARLGWNSDTVPGSLLQG
jgi:hypothetical protein